MKKLSTFEILVHNQGGIVKTGDILRGEVVIETVEDIEVKDIRIVLMGKCHVQWTEAKNTAPMAEIQMGVVDPVVSEETYINECHILFPSHLCDPNQQVHQKEETVILTKGSHTFDFHFTIPATVPSSFDSDKGYVRYFLKATVDRPCKCNTNVRLITVASQLDLNNLPLARSSDDVSDHFKVSSILFSSGMCHARMRLLKKGFTPSELVPIELTINNDTHHEINRIVLQLKMTVTYRSRGKKSSAEIVLSKKRLTKLPAGRMYEGTFSGIHIPAMCPPSYLPGCNFISIGYELQLKIKPSILSLNRLRLSSNIIVGTVPVDLTTYMDNPPSYWACCPPSYEDVLAENQRRNSFTASATCIANSSIAISTPNLTISTDLAEANLADNCRRTLNNELRMTVIGKEPALESDSSLFRPRANTGPISGLLRARGR